MISSNLAGLLVVLGGAAILYQRYKHKGSLQDGAMRGWIRRGAGVFLLLAVLAATATSAVNLSRTAPPVMILAPAPPQNGRITTAMTAGDTRYLLTALLVREADGKVVAAWEKTSARPGDSLSVPDSDAGPLRRISKARAYLPASNGMPEWVEFLLPARWSGMGNAAALGSGRAFIPKVIGRNRSAGALNLFSLLSSGGDLHFLCFVTPMSEGQQLCRVNAQTMISEMQWLRAPIRARNVDEYLQRKSSLSESEIWRAAPARERNRLYDGWSGALSEWASAFGWAAVIGFLAIPWCFAASARRRRTLKFVVWVGFMLLLAVACERGFMALSPEPDSAHRFFTAAPNSADFSS